MNKLRKLIVALTMFIMAISSEWVSAQQATWIYYPGDYEIWLGNQVQNRRTERGTFLPPFWKMDSHHVLEK